MARNFSQGISQQPKSPLAVVFLCYHDVSHTRAFPRALLESGAGVGPALGAGLGPESPGCWLVHLVPDPFDATVLEGGRAEHKKSIRCVSTGHNYTVVLQRLGA